MIQMPMDVRTQYPIRKGRKQKEAFRQDVQRYLESLGYAVTIEKGSMGAKNVIAGNPAGAKYLITAHYDTPAGMPIPNLITPCNFVTFLLYQLLLTAGMLGICFVAGLAAGLLLKSPEIAGVVAYAILWLLLGLMMLGPANKSNANDNTSGVVTVLEIARTLPVLHRDKVCFVLFDLEEAGLIGSSSYRKAHKKESQNQLVLNLDCVGDGDEIVFFPGKKVRKNAAHLAALRSCAGTFGEKQISLREKGFAYYPSDQANFPLGVGIAAMHRSKWAGLWLGRIHTKKDTILEETNVNLLRAALSSVVTSGEQTGDHDQ